MKKLLIIVIAIAAITFAACNSSNKFDNTANSNDTGQVNLESNNAAATSSSNPEKANSSINKIVAGYLQLKNALAKDDGKEAANAGKAIVDAMQKFDRSSLTPEKKKMYEDMESAMKENAEHIAENADKLDHQREHFEMLSQDMYDMVKTYGAEQTLYKDYCPMYNNKKGASWISETKEITNPYLGKKMPTCGELKEEIKL